MHYMTHDMTRILRQKATCVIGQETFTIRLFASNRNHANWIFN